MHHSDEMGFSTLFLDLNARCTVLKLSAAQPCMGDEAPLNFNNGTEEEEWMTNSLQTVWSLNGAVTQRGM